MKRLLPLLLLLLSSSAHAQSNFEGLQLGGRTALMGGAAVARGADEATPFMNPAGITRIPGQSFSFSTFAATMGNRTIKGALDPSNSLGLEDANAGQVTVRIVPNTFCLFLDGPPKDKISTRSRHKYAFCAAATERERMEFTQNRLDSEFTSKNFQGASQATDMEFTRSTVVMSWGLELDETTNIGVTARTDNTRFKDSTSATSFSSMGTTGTYQAFTLARNSWSWDTSLTVGMTSQISRVMTLGVALTTPSQHLIGSYTGMISIASQAASAQGVVQDDGDFRYNAPGNLRLGLAFTWPKLTLEVNGSFYGPQKQRARANFDRRIIAYSNTGDVGSVEERGALVERGQATTNVAVGAEYFLASDFAILGGLQTDFSGLSPRVDQSIGEVLFRQQKNSIYASLGVGSYGKLGRLLLGLRGNYSWGKASIADPTPATPLFVALPQSEWDLSLVISGHISFRTVKETAVRAANPITRALQGKDGDKEEK